MIDATTFGNSARVHDATRLECRICWYVYDPGEGDPMEQISPGTPFRQLPDHWRCPQCNAGQHAFLPAAD
jgi:rubredoxin